MKDQITMKPRASSGARLEGQRLLDQAEARGPRVMTSVLWIALALAAVAIAAFFFLRLTPPGQTSVPPTTPAGTLDVQGRGAATQSWEVGHMGAEGLEKCRAFRQVVTHTHELQAADGGTISPAHRMGLEAELNAAKAMAPAAVTPQQCGVPL